MPSRRRSPCDRAPVFGAENDRTDVRANGISDSSEEKHGIESIVAQFESAARAEVEEPLRRILGECVSLDGMADKVMIPPEQGIVFIMDLSRYKENARAFRQPVHQSWEAFWWVFHNSPAGRGQSARSVFVVPYPLVFPNEALQVPGCFVGSFVIEGFVSWDLCEDDGFNCMDVDCVSQLWRQSQQR
jgi:hypothetical protein